MSSRLRRLCIAIHLWLGLISGLLVSISGLSGSVLVFRHELEPRFERKLRSATPHGEPSRRASWQAVVEAAQRAAPDQTIQHIFVGRTDDDAHQVWLKGGRRVYVDPYLADGRTRVLGAGQPEDGFFGFLSELHIRLLSRESGHVIIGIGGLFLIALGLTGLVAWWPRSVAATGSSFWRRGFTVRWKTGAKVANYDLHRVLGMASSALLLLVATCGVSLVWAEHATTIAYSLFGGTSPTPPKAGIAQAGDAVPLDLLVERGSSALPQARLSRISFPSKPDAPLALRFRQPGELHPNGTSVVHLDPHAGRVLRVTDATQASGAQRILNLRYPLHIGTWGDTWSRMLHVLLGLMPAFLYISGLAIWITKQRGKWRNRGR